MTNRISPGINVIHTNYQCDGNLNNPSAQRMDARGVTYWRGDTNQYTLLPNNQDHNRPESEVQIQFTCTQPRCYQCADNCIVYFRTYALYNPNNDVGVILQTKLNDSGNFGENYIPGTGHGNYQAIDVGRSDNQYYHSNGQNTFTIINMSTTATVRVDNFQVIRVYGMCCLACDCQDDCDDDNSCIGGDPCKSESYKNPSGDFVTRADYPCNLDGNGTRGYTYYLDRYFTGTDDSQPNYSLIQPGDSLQWNFNWSGDSQYIYQGREVCLFNFNQIMVDSRDNNLSQNPHIELDAYLNGSSIPFAKYYLCKSRLYGEDRGLFPSFDLATLGNYNDSGSNYVQLKNMSDVRVQMSAGAQGDGINIYRTYITGSAAGCPCQDCQTLCQLSCETCYTCQGPCQFTCYACDGTCETACDAECQDCQEPCQLECQNCQTGCEVCEDPCQLSCQTCNTCQDCQVCVGCVQCYEWGCEECEVCYAGGYQ